jgi:putative redox protein
MALEAHLKWTDGLQFIAKPTNGPAVVLDDTESRSGPTPMEMVLIGVAGCTAMDVISIMKKKRALVEAFKVQIKGEQAEKNPMRFTHIHIDYMLKGMNIKSAAVEQAIKLSEEKYCSAMASINADITHSYQIEEEE